MLLCYCTGVLSFIHLVISADLSNDPSRRDHTVAKPAARRKMGANLKEWAKSNKSKAAKKTSKEYVEMEGEDFLLDQVFQSTFWKVPDLEQYEDDDLLHDPDYQDYKNGLREDTQSHRKRQLNNKGKINFQGKSFRDLYFDHVRIDLKSKSLSELAQDWLLNDFLQWPCWLKQIPLLFDKQLLEGIRNKQDAALRKRAALYAKRSLKLFKTQSHSSSFEKFFLYVPYQGLSNQFIQLSKAAVLASSLKRTLIVPPMIVSHHQVDNEDNMDGREFFKHLGLTPMLPWSTMYNLTAWNSKVSMIPLSDALITSLLTRNSKSKMPPIRALNNCFEDNLMVSPLGYGGSYVKGIPRFLKQQRYIFSKPENKFILPLLTYGKWDSVEALGSTSDYFFKAFNLSPQFDTLPGVHAHGHHPIPYRALFDYMKLNMAHNRIIAVSNLQHVHFRGAENKFLKSAKYSDFMLGFTFHAHRQMMEQNPFDSSRTDYVNAPYLGMHWRGGDWKGACRSGSYKKSNRCYPSEDIILSKIADLKSVFLNQTTKITDEFPRVIVPLDTKVCTNEDDGLQMFQFAKNGFLLSKSNMTGLLAMLDKVFSKTLFQLFSNATLQEALLKAWKEKRSTFEGATNTVEPIQPQLTDAQSNMDYLMGVLHLGIMGNYAWIHEDLVSKSNWPITTDENGSPKLIEGSTFYERLYMNLRQLFHLHGHSIKDYRWRSLLRSVFLIGQLDEICEAKDSIFEHSYTPYMPAYGRLHSKKSLQTNFQFPEPALEHVDIGIVQSPCDLIDFPSLLIDPLIATLYPFILPMLDTVTMSFSDIFLGNVYSTFSKSACLHRNIMLSEIDEYVFKHEYFLNEPSEQVESNQEQSYGRPIADYF